MSLSPTQLAESRKIALAALKLPSSATFAREILTLLDEIDLLRNRIMQAKLMLDGRAH